MARLVHFMSDELVSDGHQIDFLFHEDLLLPVPSRARRFMVPLRIVQIVHQLRRAGKSYDAVEIHEPSAAAYALARRFDRSLPPLVTISHGVEARCRRMMIDYLSRKGHRIFPKQRYGYYLTTLWQSNFALRHADHVVVLNTEDRTYLTDHFRVPQSRITVIHSAAGAPFLDCPDGPSSGLGVLFLASWLDRKGTIDAVPILTRVARECPGTPITVAGCGKAADAVLADFPPDCRAAIRVIPNINSDAALLTEYRKHSIYLLPSVFEGQPLTMFEAAAAGLALVSTATCGMKDFIRDGENGLLANVGDTVGLADAVLQLVRNPSLSARLGQQAQRDARLYTWKRSAEQYLKGIAAVVRQPRRPPYRSNEP